MKQKMVVATVRSNLDLGFGKSYSVLLCPRCYEDYSWLGRRPSVCRCCGVEFDWSEASSSYPPSN